MAVTHESKITVFTGSCIESTNGHLWAGKYYKAKFLCCWHHHCEIRV